MTETTDLFLALTPDRILDALDGSGLRTNPVCYALNSFENRVYEIELEDRTRVIAKFYRPSRWTPAQIAEEHAYTAELAEAEIPVCPVKPFPNGETLLTVEGIHFCLFERRGGRAPEELNDTLAERLGMLTARMHNVGAKRPAPTRVKMSAERWIGENLDFLDGRGLIPRHLSERYMAAARHIAEVARTRLSQASMHRIHGDLHLGNLLLREGVLNVLDFDDMVIGPAVQDLWMLLPGRDDWSNRLRNVFLEGYEQFRSFDETTLALIEPLRGMRMVHYSAWLGRRWHDPIFPLTWPQFDTLEYWEQETKQLEDIASLSTAGGQASSGVSSYRGHTPEEDPSELTNADYFFDWED